MKTPDLIKDMELKLNQRVTFSLFLENVIPSH
jgi:hypothetical protein